MTAKKTTAKKPAGPKLCLRQIDKTTQLMSKDPQFAPVPSAKKVEVPKGFTRVDKSTVVKTTPKES